MLQRIIPADQPLWIFAYGSLMWNPGFDYVKKQTVRIHGHHRALCVWSWHYRGNKQRPGLVFGLDRGGSCVGQAFRISSGKQGNVLEYLYAREMITDVYRPSLVKVCLENTETVQALTFIVDRGHVQYAGRLSADTLLQTIQQARGSRGPNHEYVRNTIDQLSCIGYQDSRLQLLNQQLPQANSPPQGSGPDSKPMNHGSEYFLHP